MSDEVVLDASVAADHFFPGPGSGAARAFVRSGRRMIAPDLLFAEFASVAIKFVRRGLVPAAVARDSIARLPLLVHDVVPLGDLTGSAYDLAAGRSFSVYDAFYLALALRRGVPLVTADAKLARRAVDLGMADHVLLLSPES
jgi:predicted nucleic acid-binding protein